MQNNIVTEKLCNKIEDKQKWQDAVSHVKKLSKKSAFTNLYARNRFHYTEFGHCIEYENLKILYKLEIHIRFRLARFNNKIGKYCFFIQSTVTSV